LGRHRAAYLHTLHWNCVTAADPDLFQAPFRAGIRLDAYQLEPLRRALRMPRVNLFIADDVGLGKTIEAALILRELLLRKKARDIVVAAPPSMLEQWREELAQRFGLEFAILDKDYVQAARREFGFGVNPWNTHSRFLVSHRLLIDEAYRAPLLDWLRPPTAGICRPASVLVLDEAHHAAPASGQRYAIDSQITKAIRELAPHFEHRLFLSATPHNGHSNSFSALLEILDPQRFVRGVKPSPGAVRSVMVRRLKEDLRALGESFPKRVVAAETIDHLPADAPELRLAELLEQYRLLREDRLAGAPKSAQAASGLVLCHLQQRLLSSCEAFWRSLRWHRAQAAKKAMAADAPAAESAPGAPAPNPPAAAEAFPLLRGGVGSDDDRAGLDAEDLAAETEGQLHAATQAAGGTAPAGKEADLLAEMEALAAEHRALPDARIRRLREWIRREMCPQLGSPGAQWNDRRLIIFTEFDDTRRYIEQQLRGAIADTDRAEERIAIFHGATRPQDREQIKLAFNELPNRAPVRILIATDAAREGLNLQAHCRDLFHFDLPWNPARLEQRNGRIDRKLQPAKEVHCRYFVYAQRPEDMILEALVRKTETIRAELGSVAEVIGSRVESLLARGIERRRLEEVRRAIEATEGDEQERRRLAEEEMEEARDRQEKLAAQTDRLRDRIERSRRQTGFSEAPFRRALSAALAMMGAEELRPAEGGEQPRRYLFPALDRQARADPTWAETLDSLRPPRQPGQPFWQWRAQAAPRPVVFRDTGTVTEEVVQLHLEQAVVRRLLGRFLAQGFVFHDLSRACLAQTEDAIPRVLLLGRLALYGGGAARLHEELLLVGARWRDPARRGEPLAPYGQEGADRSWELLEKALEDPPGRVPEEVARRLQDSVQRDVAELLPRLAARGQERAARAREKLAHRAAEEAEAMRRILQEHKDHLARTIAEHDRAEQQRKFAFMREEERRQLEADRKYWRLRLPALDRELEAEPERVRQVYDVHGERLEPIGLVYLWPVSG
jgi:ERCC4-related helicase